MKLHELERQFCSSSLNRIDDADLQRQGIELWLKRDDLLHPIISGNKWRKLKYILRHAMSLRCSRIVSMGGAYSNHLHALAYAGKLLGVETAAFVRGEQAKKVSSTLRDIQNWGMQLSYISRSEYRQLRSYKSFDSLPGMQSGDYWLPEGGATELALQGVAEIINEIDLTCDVLALPCGTGTTLAGLVKAAPDSLQLLGISALKGANFLYQDVSNLLPGAKRQNWSIDLDYHFGGFAKTNDSLNKFILRFEQRQGIALDRVYTGKMMFALFDLVRQGQFFAGQRIIALHTGGLQGMRR